MKTRGSVAALTNHSTDAFVPENVVCVYEVMATFIMPFKSLRLKRSPFSIEKWSGGKGVF